jgi:hypothetical protein
MHRHLEARFNSRPRVRTGKPIDLTGNENYFIYEWHNRFTNFLFNSSLLVPGQHVSTGGPSATAL